jgi:hypothetical protein
MFGGSYKKLMPLSNQLEGPILITKHASLVQRFLFQIKTYLEHSVK